MKRVVAVLAVFLMVAAPAAWAQIGSSSDAPEADARVTSALDLTDIFYMVDDDGDARIVENVNDGRTQLVWVRSATYELGHLEVREIWSPAYVSDTPLSAKLGNRLLKDSANMILGGWQLHNWGDDNVVLYVVQIDADADAKTIRQAVRTAAVAADKLEEELTHGEDEY